MCSISSVDAHAIDLKQSKKHYTLLDVQNRLDFRVYPIMTSRELGEIAHEIRFLPWGWVFDTNTRLLRPMAVKEGKLIRDAPKYARESKSYPVYYNAFRTTGLIF